MATGERWLDMPILQSASAPVRGLATLPERQRRGSRARCILLTGGSDQEVAGRLSEQIECFVDQVFDRYGAEALAAYEAWMFGYLSTMWIKIGLWQCEARKQVSKSIRARHHGGRRNPTDQFDEPNQYFGSSIAASTARPYSVSTKRVAVALDGPQTIICIAPC
jgi:hypothetical protein